MLSWLLAKGKSEISIAALLVGLTAPPEMCDGNGFSDLKSLTPPKKGYYYIHAQTSTDSWRAQLEGWRDTPCYPP